MMLQRALLLDYLKILSPDGWSLVFEQVTPLHFLHYKRQKAKEQFVLNY
jgi:hypothetical protein